LDRGGEKGRREKAGREGRREAMSDRVREVFRLFREKNTLVRKKKFRRRREGRGSAELERGIEGEGRREKGKGRREKRGRGDGDPEKIEIFGYSFFDLRKFFSLLIFDRTERLLEFLMD
jgi:hypothetical protein